MSDCKCPQTTHAVVITEDPLSEHQWTANPKVLCVGQNDTITFYTMSVHTQKKDYVIEPVEKDFFASSSLGICRNSQKGTTIKAKEGAESDIHFNPKPKSKGEDLLLPILRVIVRH